MPAGDDALRGSPARSGYRGERPVADDAVGKGELRFFAGHELHSSSGTAPMLETTSLVWGHTCETCDQELLRIMFSYSAMTRSMLMLAGQAQRQVVGSSATSVLTS